MTRPGRKFLIILKFALLLVLSCGLCVYGQQNEKKNLLKRTVLMLPFVNINKVSKYDYLAGTISDALKSELLKTGNFQFIGRADADDMMKKMKLAEENLSDEKNIYELSSRLKADVIVTGKYMIIDDKIMIQIEALDVFTKQSAALSTTNGELGLDLFRAIDDSAKDMSGKMADKLKPVDKTYFEQMNSILKKEARLKIEKIFTPTLRSGIILTAVGGGLMTFGLPVFIYDLAGYSSTVTAKQNSNPRTDLGYRDYLNASYTYIALFASSLSSACLGLVLMAVGIPLIVYDLKKKDKKVSLDAGFENGGVVFSCTFRFE